MVHRARWWMAPKMKFRGEANSIRSRVRARENRAERVGPSRLRMHYRRREFCEAGNKLPVVVN